MRRFAVLVALAAGCSDPPPHVSSVSPHTLCANVESQLMIMGSDLDIKTVYIGAPMDMGPAAVASTKVTGGGSMATATFAANSLTPADLPYDVVVVNKDDQRTTFKAAVTVVAGISIAAFDPKFVYAGVDFPTSLYGTGMGGVTTISISLGGGTPIDLTGVTAVDNNRVDAVVPMGLAAGAYDVTVTDSDGCTASAMGALQVVTDVTVSVCAIDPGFGFNGGTTDVSITATGDGKPMGTTCGGKMVTFASTPRAWLNVGGVLHELANVAFVSEGSLTGTVPNMLTVGDPYDLIVQNPDGSVGLLTGAFKVVDMPVPHVTGINPPVVPLNVTTPFSVFGDSFRAGVKVFVYGPSGALIEVPGVKVTSNLLSFSLNPGALGLAVGAYVVRVTDTAQGTYGEFSALGVISSSTNLTPWQTTAPQLPNAVMRQGAAAGQVSTAARYLYVVGGDTGAGAGAASDATQIASLDRFGGIGAWMIGRNKLAAPRTRLQLVSIAPKGVGGSPFYPLPGGYLYAVGGETAAGALTTVSRAQILLPSDAPQIVKTTVGLPGMLSRGSYYYRVSAMLDGSDAANPNGETLPSQLIVAHAVDQAKVTIEWQPRAKAATYRVYRTTGPDLNSTSVVLLKDGLTATTFVDDGTLPATGTGTPLQQGELGLWVDVPALNDARRSLGAVLAPDPSSARFLYAIAGDKGTGGTVTGAQTYDSYEFASVADDGLTLGTWTRGANKLVARTRLAAAVGEGTSSPAVPAATPFVYAIGGFDGAAVVNSYQAGQVQAGGSLGAWTAVGPATNSTSILQGLSSLIASNQLFAIGGANAFGTVIQDAVSVTYTTPPQFGNLNSDPNLKRDASGTQIVAAYTSLVLSSAHLYLLGGTVDGTTALKRVWNIVY